MSSIENYNLGLPSRGWDLWIVSTVMVVVAGVFVVARLAGRYVKGEFRIDDYTIFAALVGYSAFASAMRFPLVSNKRGQLNSVVLTVAENMAVSNGYGRHAIDLTENEIIMSLKWFYVAQVFYKIVITLTKMSILFLYLRIFYIEAYFRWACTALNVFIAACGTAFVLATIWQCHPMAAFWDKSIPAFRCADNHAFWLSYSVINIITDILILILPLQEVLRLQLRCRDKFALVLVFSLGAFVCVTSIIRATTVASSSTMNDLTWTAIPATIWSVVECNTGIICACLPMIRQPLSIIFPFLSSNPSRTQSTCRSLPLPHSMSMNDLSRVINPATSARSDLSWMDMEIDSQKTEAMETASSAKRKRFPVNDSEHDILSVNLLGEHNRNMMTSAKTSTSIC
ncbi:hypothetical protein PABG_05480 [Paracoccidioides brasiliensis Pb03]|nr:hypothetical protein PABG_05480 [Paracoccidioides brasiliensis Pb03]